ncbi:MAG: hypothetical protein NVSMB22_13980 [Chloroflexota bacterium]
MVEPVDRLTPAIVHLHHTENLDEQSDDTGGHNRAIGGPQHDLALEYRVLIAYDNASYGIHLAEYRANTGKRGMIAA